MTALWGFTAESFQFGPNSTLDLYSAFDEEIVEPGTYHIQIELSAPRGTWVLRIPSLFLAQKLKRSIENDRGIRLSSQQPLGIYCCSGHSPAYFQSITPDVFATKKSKETTEQE